ncbi:GNAT family N-acetyltransferase [Bacillus sp. EAC]|uniref:GNAT family N-acetyltransferase n=1 Tax=Bacillus sp. EAC TaxID=1978338 RepID=UPI000B444882|nr:GNAT family protein [Bacillus sp. EAC]
MFKIQLDSELSINLLTPKYAGILVEALIENQECLKEWLIWAETIPSVEEYKKTIIPMWLQKFADNNGFETAIFYKDELIGMAGLHYIDWTNQATEIGYWLSNRWQGKGIMTRVVEGLTTYCFKELELNRVVIRAAVENRKSRAIPERLEFKEEGILRAAQQIRGSSVDLAIYSMLKQDWKQRNK